MPVLANDRHEKFAQLLAMGHSQMQAYQLAGFGKSSGRPAKLAHDKRVVERVSEIVGVATRAQLIETKKAKARQSKTDTVNALIQHRALDKAAERMALTKESVAREVALLAFANMQDYTRVVGPDLTVDFSSLTRDQFAAIREVTVDTFVEGTRQNENGEEEPITIKRVRFKLHDKRAALMDLARLFGWVVERNETTLRLEERLAAMKPAERAEDARNLLDRVRQRLIEDQIDGPVIDGEAAEIVE